IGKGSISIKPEEVKRAIASARYATYATSEARLSSLEPIGQAILDTGKVANLDEVVSGFDKITPEKLKQVHLIFGVTIDDRLPPRWCNQLRLLQLLDKLICCHFMMSFRISRSWKL